jgi:hypothetical protein
MSDVQEKLLKSGVVVIDHTLRTSQGKSAVLRGLFRFFPEL